MDQDSNRRGFVRLDRLRLENGSYMEALRTHPKWVSNGTIRGWHPWIQMPSNAIFEAKVGFVYGARRTDGVTFWVFEHHMEGGREVWNPIVMFTKGYTGQLVLVSADLSHLAGQDMQIELRVDAGKSSAQDWAVWVDPVIIVK